MKKLLCFALGVLLSITGLKAQQTQAKCITFREANLYPREYITRPNTTQSIFINFNYDGASAFLQNDGKYAVQYEFYEDGVLMTDQQLESMLNRSQTTFTTRFSGNNYYGQNITHASDYFPNGYFNASSNMSSYAFNYFNGKYLNTADVALRLNLGWRADYDYANHHYMLVVKLVTLEGGHAQQWYYNNNSNIPIGGSNATLVGDAGFAPDTITSIIYSNNVIRDTVCYSEFVSGDYTVGRTTINGEYIASHTNNNTNTPFAYVIKDTIEFDAIGTHGCNDRIDSIVPVTFYVWPELKVSFNSSGHVSSTCEGTAFGKLSMHFENIKKPCTIRAYYSESADGPFEYYGTKTKNSNGTFNFAYDGLQIGYYYFEIEDATGCTARTPDVRSISEATPKNWGFTITPKDPTCRYGNDGTIKMIANNKNYGGPVFTLTDSLNTTITYNFSSTTSALAVDTIFKELGSGKYYLFAQDRRGCSPSTNPQIIELGIPDSLYSDTIIYCCASDLVEGVHFADSIFYTADVEEVEGAAPQAHKAVHFTSAQGCDSVVNVTLIPMANPVIAFDNLQRSVCQNEELEITLVIDPSYQNSYSDYHWTYSDGTLADNPTDNGSSIKVKWAEAGEKVISANYTFTYQLADREEVLPCRAVKDTTNTITVNALPNNTISTLVNRVDSSMNIVACAGDTITLTAVNNYDYSWSQNGTVVFTEGNEFVLKDVTSNDDGKYVLVITNNETGCVNTSDTVNITVNTPRVVLRDQMEDVTICPNNNETELSVTVNPEFANGEITYQWFMDGVKITDSIRAKYKVEGLTDTTIYMVEVTATVGACTATAYDTIVVNVNNPNVTLTPMEDQTICAAIDDETGTTVEALVASSHGNLTYAWTSNMNASFSDPAIANPAVTLTDTTTIYLHVIATIGTNADNSCTAVAKDTVIINVNAPMVELTPMDDQTICAGDTFTLRPAIIAASYKSDETTYLWNTGATSDTLNVSPAVARDYSVVVTAKIGDCTVSAYDTVNVAVLAPSVTLGDTITGVRTICAGTQIPLTAWATGLVNGTLTYTWNNQMTGATINVSPTDTTKYIVIATATLSDDRTTCHVSDTDSVVINVNNPLIRLNDIVSTATNNTICLHDTLKLTASANADMTKGTVTYQWLDGEETIGSDAQLIVVPTDNHDYSVIATATIGTCTKQDTRNYSIYVNAPAIVMNQIASQTICLGSNVLVNATTNTNVGTVTYTWTPEAPDTVHANLQAVSTNNTNDNASMVGTPTHFGGVVYQVIGTALVNTNDVECRAKDTVEFTLFVNDTIKNFTATNLTQNAPCAGEDAIQPVEITVENGTVSVFNLPQGLVFENNTISGTPTTATIDGNNEPTFNEILIVATSNQTPACTPDTLVFNLAVNPVVDITVTGDTTFEICVGSAMANNLLFTPVHGIDPVVAGLPRGMEYSANGMYGTPDTVGVFHYTVTVASDQRDNVCDSKTLTGTITVKDTVKYKVTNDLSQTLCWQNMGDTVKVTYENATVTNTTATGLGTLTGENYVWIFRNEETSIGDHGFSISLASTNNCSVSDKTVEGNITVNDTVKFTITGDTTFAVCVGSAINPVKISAESVEEGHGIGGIIIENLPDGLTYTTEEGIHGIPTTVGTFQYTVSAHNRFTGSNGSGCELKSFTGTITVNDTVRLSYLSTDGSDTVCLGNAITDISVDTANCTLSIAWNNEPEGITFANGIISGAPTAAGEYTYTITATSDKTPACTEKSLTGVITVHDTVTLSATNTKQQICLGNAITAIEIEYNNDVSNITVSFNNDDNNGLVVGEGTISGTPGASGNIIYTITATSFTEPSCGSKTITDTIFVNDTVVTITTINAPGIDGNTYVVCANASETNDTITFTTAADMTNYAWNVGDGTIISGNNTNSIQVQWTADGDKSVTVAYTNEHGCRGTSAPAAIKVYEAPTFTVAGSAANNHLCAYADATDTLKITATNDLTAIHYEWTPNGLTEITGTDNMVFGGSNLTFGEHTYTVVATSSISDVTNCQVTNSITINVDTLPVVVLTKHDPRCHDDINGDAIATVSGSEPFTYIWNNNCNNANNLNIGWGTHIVTVTDIHGCSTTDSIKLNNPELLVPYKVARQDVLCHGDNSGYVTLSANGGTTFIGDRYQYRMGTTDTRIILGTEHTFDGLAKGIYTFFVLDSNGCIAEIIDTIKQPGAALSATEDMTAHKNVTCYGDANGSVTITATGGTAPYTYALTSGNGDANSNNNNYNYSDNGVFTGLPGGLDTVIVTDANGCTDTVAIEIIEFPHITLTKGDTTNIDCFGNHTGVVAVTAANGTGNYQYKIDDGNYGTEASFNELVAGTHVVTVVDDSNCTASVTFVLEEPDALTVAIDSTNINCYGDETGAIRLTVSGGTTPYTYAWDGATASNSNEATDLAAGRHTVTITDAHNCTLDTVVTLTQPNALIAAVDEEQQVNVSCNGERDGSIRITVTGGTANEPYIYTLKSTGVEQVGDSVFTNLAAGLDTVIVRDNNGCTDTVAFEITEPAVLTATATQRNVDCHGNNTGAITVTATGGTEPYTYKLKNSESDEFGTSNIFDGLYAGIDTVIVKDNHGCEFKLGFEITQHEELTLNKGNTTNINCYGDETGTVAVIPAGGTGHYTYNISDNANEYVADSIFRELAAGTHVVTVKDDSNCTASVTFVLEQPNAALAVVIDSTNINCYGDETGAISLTVSGGTPDYTYAWSDNASANTASRTQIAAGTYRVTVTDANRCTLDTVVTLTQPTAALSANITAQRNVDCNGNNTGAITVTATGGTEPYTYKLKNSTADFGESNVFDGLAAGIDTVIVKDDHGCEFKLGFEITQHEELTLNKGNTTNIDCYGNHTGVVAVTAAGGTGNYQYQIDNENYGTEASFDELAAGTHVVTVKDDSNCTASVTFVLEQPAQLAAELALTMVDCHSNRTGAVAVNVTEGSGTAPYTYKLKSSTADFGESNVFDGLAAGLDTVFVKDANGCEIKLGFEITEPDTLVLSVASVDGEDQISNVTCFGANDGRLQLAVSGGTDPRLFSWDGGQYSGTSYMSNLIPGDHIITVIDNNQCTDTLRIEITQPELLTVTHDSTNLTCFETNDGRIDITVAGGTRDYTYIWQDQVTTEDRSNLAAGTYYLMVSDANECKAYDTITITQPENFIVKVSGIDEICAGEHTDFTANFTFADSTYSYQWYKDGAPITDSTALHLNNVTVAGTYWMTATQSTSLCVKADTITLTVYDLPNVAVSGTADTICFGGEVTYTATGADSYEWAEVGTWSEATSLEPSDNTAHIVGNTVGTFHLSVTGSAVNGDHQVTCTKTVNDTVTVLALPEVAISGHTEICAGIDDTLTADGATTYEWEGDYITAIEGITNKVVFNATQPIGDGYLITVTGTDDFGCQNTADITIIVNPLPVADIRVGEMEDIDHYTNLMDTFYFCAGTEISLINNEADGDDYSYQWFYINGQDVVEISGENGNEYETTVSQTRTYIMHVTDRVTGCENSDTVTIIMNELPKVNLSEDYNANRICVDSNFHFTVGTDVEDVENITWVHNSVQLMGVDQYTYTTNVGGAYVVNLTDGNGCIGTSDTLTVVVDTLPAVTLTEDYQASRICADSNFHFTVATAATTIQWMNGTEEINNADATTYTTNESGLYFVTVTDGNGCSNNSNELEVVVDTIPNVTVTPSDEIVVCMQSETELTATGAVEYSWTFIDDIGANTLSENIFSTGTVDVPGTADTYRIEVTGTDGNSCSAKDTITIEVKDLQNTAVISLPEEVTLCENEKVGFKVNAEYSSYTWTSNLDNSLETNTDQPDTVTFTATTNGDFYVNVKVEDENGCQATATTTVHVNGLPDVTVNSVNNTFCQSDTITFTTEEGMTNYTWTYPTDNATETYKENGTLKVVWSDYGQKSVSVNYTDGNGCRAEEATEINVDVNVLPNIVINPGDFDTVCLGQTEIITVDGGVSYVWSTGEEWSTNSADNALSITPVTDSIVSVIGTDMNGCKNYDTIRFIVNDTVKFTITNAEQFICVGNPIEPMVFDTANCTLNLDVFASVEAAHLTVVNDTVKGSPIESGTYSYALEATSTAVPACYSKYANVTIYVYDTAHLVVTNATQNLCLGNPIEAIVIDTANCILTFEPELATLGLTFDDEASTIGGTFTEAGVYTFTIKATSTTNYCGSYNKEVEVTITVNDTNKLAAVNPTNLEQVFCLGEPMTAIVLDTANCVLSFEPELSHGISYDTESHSIIGIPDTAMVFSYTITATNENGCNEPKTLAITITVNDTAKLELLSDNSRQKFCLGDTIEPIAFKTANGTASMTLATPSAAGIVFANDTITGIPTEPGTYVYTIYVANENQCRNKEFSDTIIVDTLPVVTLTSDQEDDLICPNGQEVATLTATPSTGVTYAWAHSTTTVTDTAIVMPVADSTFTVTVTDGNGCQSSATITLGVHTLPEVTINDGNGDTICFGDEIRLVVNVADEMGVEYEWNVDDVEEDEEVEEGNVFIVAPEATTEYIVTVTDMNGCTITDTNTVVVDTLPLVGLTPRDLAICQNDTIVFTTNTDDTYIYVWSEVMFGDNGVSVIENDDMAEEESSEYIFRTYEAVTAPGIHGIVAQITNGNGCANSDTIRIEVKATPVLEAEYNRVRCYGETTASIDLSVDNYEGTPTYAWTDADEEEIDADGNGNLSELGAGDYTVVVTAENGCANTMTVTIEQPELLTLAIDTLNSVGGPVDSTYCKGDGSVIAIVEGGTPGYSYDWKLNGDEIDVTDSIVEIQTLAIGRYLYTLTVTDDSGCVASITDDNAWLVVSERIEVHREINLMPEETYYHEGQQLHGGDTFEEVVEQEEDCDIAYIYTIHEYGMPFHFADQFTVTHSTYRRNYEFNPNTIPDTIYTAPNVDNMFYAYVMTPLYEEFNNNGHNVERVDMKYSVLFDDANIEEYDTYINNLLISSYHEKDDRFYGHELTSADGEAPSTSFLYQNVSNNSAYYYDYFNFHGFNQIPQKIEFNFAEEGTYTIKLFVEERTGGSRGHEWGIYNPYIKGRSYGPIWGGLGDNPTGRDTLTARYMTVIVSESATTTSNPVITGVEDYTANAEPVVTTYPNPARDMLYMDIKGMEGMTYITITDATGKVVANYNENLLNSETTLNYSVANFAQGIYFLNIHNNDTVITKKFIVTK